MNSDYATKIDSRFNDWYQFQEAEQSSFFHGSKDGTFTDYDLKVMSRMELIVSDVYVVLAERQGVKPEEISPRIATHAALKMYERHFGYDCTDLFQALGLASQMR